MRLVPIRLAVYVALFAAPVVAQPPTLMSTEMPHVELSVGAAGIAAGPSVDVENRMRDLGLSSSVAGYRNEHRYPSTGVTSFLPGLFAQLQIGVREHVMVGAFVTTDETRTSGRAPDGTSANVLANLRTRAVLASYRPNPWLRFGTGPAWMDRRLVFEGGGSEFRSKALGWLTTADVKFVRRQASLGHPPAFGYVTGQSRLAPALSIPATTLPTYGRDRGSLAWPAQRVRTSHWMLGIGIGFEI